MRDKDATNSRRAFRAVLKPREDLRIRRGHPWVYDNEIAFVEGDPPPGAEMALIDSRGSFLGKGFFNPASKIRLRLYSRTGEKADKAFFEKSFSEALAWRQRFFDNKKQSQRLVFGEADNLPGLIVDLFIGQAASDATGSGPAGRWLSCQFLSLGVELRKAEIVQSLVSVFAPDGIVERSEAPVRALEGLEASSGILYGTVPENVLIEEGGALFSVDLSEGQKTGWFLDQRANRAAAARFASEARVLDVFCNQGGFGILAAKAGAAEVLAVDSSHGALAAAARNAALNGVESRFSTVEANAFDYLRSLEKEKAKFDLIILDPPAFAKSRSTVDQAYKGYKEINLRAMRLLNRGGILVSCSCSYWFDEARFETMIEDAAFDCGRRIRLIEARTQDRDHPIVAGYGESKYLKCRIMELR
ncbi:MAG: class I SAM-dependent rRNA methyltransferase [Spirochaetia bacterium]|jgi:23S rRNA (cytosine1962-C5)-methyltransferase|nr:class I SAM-dependent rRNA methyltransferase [Spirochaetia bacterium]